MGEVIQFPTDWSNGVAPSPGLVYNRSMTMNFKDDLASLAMNAKEVHSVAEAAARMKHPVLEPKLDGIRLLVHVGANRVEMFSRAGKPKTGKLPHVDAALLAAFPPNTWLDAEGVAFNADGSQNWGGAQSILGSATDKPGLDREAIRLVVFDALAIEGQDLRAVPANIRRQRLESFLPTGSGGHVMLVAQFEATQEVHDALVAHGYEGSIVKDMTAPYTSGKRGWTWTKVKLIETADVIITGFKPGQGKYEGWVGAIRFGQYHDGMLIEERGFCSGMTDDFRAELSDNKENWLGIVIEISYRTAMIDKVTGLPNYRHPQFERVRDDKAPEECTV